MEFHTFGDPHKKAMILIHGVLTPWQIWEEAIAHFAKTYYVVVPALDAHTETLPSDYLSAEEEAVRIEHYIKENLNGTVYALCGLSMGGLIAAHIFMRNRCRIGHLILDGAPLEKMPKILVTLMTRQYLTIIRKAKKRDPHVIRTFKKNFLPEKFLSHFLNFTDSMTERSVINMISSVGQGLEFRSFHTDTRILFLYGTKANELYSRISAAKLQKSYPAMEKRKFQGCLHGELAIRHPEQWIREAEQFLWKPPA